jgi:Domain of unknown function (DUF1906)
MIIDYSFARPEMSALKGNGVTSVIRYLAHDSAKAASNEEVEQLHAAGLSTAFVFEDAADRATAGKDAGEADGLFAASSALALSVPRGRPVYCAVDFDIPDYAPDSTDARVKLGPVGEYLTAFGVQLAVRGYSLGAYGGYWLVSRVYDASLTPWLWQTTAWSGGMIYPRVRLYQPGAQVLGDEGDIDLAGAEDWGQWRRAVVNLAGGQA